MNRIRLWALITCLGGLIHPILAQPPINDSTEAYQYWAQRGIIEMVYTYMEDHYARKEGRLNEAEKKGMENFKGTFIIDSLVTIAKLNQQIANISDYLQNNDWTNTNNLIFSPLIEKYKDKSPLNDTFFSIGGSYETENWIKTSRNIVKKYNTELQNLADSLKPESTTSQQHTLAEEEQTTNNAVSTNEKANEKTWYKWVLNIAFFVFGILTGGWLVFLISKHGIYSILSYEKNKYLHELRLSNKRFIFKYVGLFFILKKRKEEYKSEVEKRNNKATENNPEVQIEKLKKVNSELIQKLNNIPPTNNEKDLGANTRANEQEIIKPEIKKQKLFFSMPENDGRFIINNGESSNDGRKYFKIEYLVSSEQGELFYISSDRDKRAINRLESYLKPVCEIENILHADSATRIDFVRPGRVILIDGSWVIDTEKKAKIKLI